MPRPQGARNLCRTLLVIDNAPLQAAAWAELLHARKRLEKANGDVHRHEQVDEPAYQSWLTATFPVLLSALRELAQKIQARQQILQAVEAESFLTGRPPSRIWREWQKHGGQPPPPPPDEEPEDFTGGGDASNSRSNWDPFAAGEARFHERMRDLFGDDGPEQDNPFDDDFDDFADGNFGFPTPSGFTSRGPVSEDARGIYRRLVRHLHPDTGGEWTPSRARLWEQVQAAWIARDFDCLARLESEWEASADLLTPRCPVGRIRAAIAALHAARRDAERRVRAYRRQDAWRFSLRPHAAKLHERLHQRLRQDEAVLRQQLDEIEGMFAQWERVPPRRQGRRGRLPTWQQQFGF